MQQVYGWRAVVAAVQQLEKDGYFVYEVPGVLVDGYICLAPDEKHWNIEFKETYLNEWSSGLTMRRFTNLSQRQRDIIERIEAGEVVA